MIAASDLDGGAAMLAAARTSLVKRRGERDTEFVKRIVVAYYNAQEELAERVAATRRLPLTPAEANARMVTDLFEAIEKKWDVKRARKQKD